MASTSRLQHSPAHYHNTLTPSKLSHSITASMPSVERLSEPTTGNVLPYPQQDADCVIRVNFSDSAEAYPDPVVPSEGAPNIILIMTDDVGFGASSTFGGPCSTSTMDKLAEEGISYNRFHTTALCSPTRAALLTGRNPHNCGQGIIAERCLGFPGYNFLMPKSCGTVAEVLKQNGYNTAWFGKNHNVPEWQMSQSGPFDLWPTNLGFEYFYGFLGGDCNQWKPNLYKNITPIQPYEGRGDDYHLDADLADEAIKWIKQHQILNPEKPFFLYYAPGATHAPHHVPESYIKKYKGKFDDGWEALRDSTFANQLEKNIVPDDTVNTPYPSNMPLWTDLNDDQKRVYSHMMEIYAAYLEFTDHNIGRLLNEVKAQGLEENTLVIYIQGDNGGSAEGTVQGTTNELAVLGNQVEEPFSFIQQQCDDGLLGGPMNYNHFPVSWSWALNCPMQWTKRYASHFGGTRNGVVMKWPKVIKDVKTMRSQFHHAVDITPTILSAAGVPWPLDSINGVTQKPLDGMSMTYTWAAGCTEERRTEQVFEMFGNRGLYKDGYMCCTTPLVFAWDEVSQSKEYKASDFDWELYDLGSDFSQGHNQASAKPDKVEEMKSLWMAKAEQNQILPLVFTEKETIMAAANRPSLMEGRTSFNLYAGLSRVPEGSAPNLKNVSYCITAYMQSNALNTEGVIITQGGRFGGWGLVMIDGVPIWVYKLSQMPKDEYKITWHERLAVGGHKIQINFEYGGSENEIGASGTFYMTVDDDETKVVEKAVPHTVAAKFSVNETLDVGCDTGTPILDVYEAKMPFEFSGLLMKVSIDILSNESGAKRRKRMQKVAQFEIATD